MQNKAELLAPAGDFEKLQIAIAYGAEAVYLSGSSFGLRAKAKNFNESELALAIDYAHSHNVKVYVTANIYAHNKDINEMEGYFKTLQAMGADAFIVSDPGVLLLAKKEAPDIEVHISTQANITNYESAKFWHEAGANRIILARELSLDEIAEIRAKTPKSLKLEGFIHGAMCMAYSGRCMLSRYMTAGSPGGARDANLGACAHPCRYKYRLYAEEVSRPGYYMPVDENDRGVDIFGAEDLCMMEHLPAVLNAGLESLKIEGRMKTAFYVGLTVGAYRQALNKLEEFGLSEYENSTPKYMEMLKMASHRPFTTGFYFGRPQGDFEEASYTRSHNFVGIVRGYNPETGRIMIEQRGVFETGDLLTFLRPQGTSFSLQVTEMLSEDERKITRAPHAKQIVLLEAEGPVEEFTLVCKEIVM